ncbi:MAG: hypothetical protein GHCLOJNM_01554 [bacterium]|nr:hypothetical protein [bacterium]
MGTWEELLGTREELLSGLLAAFDLAGLTPEERAEFWRRYLERVDDGVTRERFNGLTATLN